MTSLEHLKVLLSNGAADLSTFAFEFRRTYGRLMPAGCCRYDDLVQVAGSGTIRRTLFASMLDPAAETGVWQVRIADGGAMRNLARKIVEANLNEAPPAHVEPGDAMFWVRVMAAGTNQTFLFSGDKLAHKRLLAEIRTALAPMIDEALLNPVRTLAMELEMPIRLPRGKVRAPVQLTFRNRGSQGHWLRNPYAPLRGEADANDIRQLTYRILPPASPTGPTPMPPQTLYATLDIAPEKTEEQPYILVEPGAEMSFAYTVSLDLSAPGRYGFDATYGAFASAEPMEGFPRWAGCLGTRRVELNIS
jgi:hypothetical protein